MRASSWMLCVCALMLSVAHAQQPSREQQQIQRLRQQVQELQKEQASAVEQSRKAVSEKQKGDEERAALEDKLKRSQSQSGRVAQLEKRLAATQAELTTLQARTTDVQSQSEKNNKELAQVRDNLAKREAAYTQLDAASKKQATQVQALMRNNEALYKLGLELLDRYQKAATADAEPFLQLKRVQLENLMQDYEDKLQKERAATPAPAPTAR